MHAPVASAANPAPAPRPAAAVPAPVPTAAMPAPMPVPSMPPMPFMPSVPYRPAVPVTPLLQRAMPAAPAMTFAPAAEAPAAAAPHADPVLSELHSMRGMIEEQLATVVWNDRQRRDPMRGRLLRTLLGAGFSARLAKAMLEHLPAEPELRPGHGLRALGADPHPAGDGRRGCAAGPGRRLRPDGPDRRRQDHHHRQARRALRDALRRRQAGAGDHRQLPDRRLRAAAHLRPDPQRAGLRGEGCDRPAAGAQRPAQQAHGADRHRRHEPARPRRLGADRHARQQPAAGEAAAAAQCRQPWRHPQRSGACLPPRRRAATSWPAASSPRWTRPRIRARSSTP